MTASDLAKNKEHPFFSSTKLPSVWKTATALFYSTGSFSRTKLPPPIIAGPVGRPLLHVLKNEWLPWLDIETGI